MSCVPASSGRVPRGRSAGRCLPAAGARHHRAGPEGPGGVRDPGLRSPLPCPGREGRNPGGRWTGSGFPRCPLPGPCGVPGRGSGLPGAAPVSPGRHRRSRHTRGQDGARAGRAARPGTAGLPRPRREPGGMPCRPRRGRLRPARAGTDGTRAVPPGGGCGRRGRAAAGRVRAWWRAVAGRVRARAPGRAAAGRARARWRAAARRARAPGGVSGGWDGGGPCPRGVFSGGKGRWRAGRARWVLSAGRAGVPGGGPVIPPGPRQGRWPRGGGRRWSRGGSPGWSAAGG
ncbi:hypothetical protein FB570_12261 [Streptomyces sp. T12]|nr:hypothetical protein FB570_12261 [Streptomyces sp. T12]